MSEDAEQINRDFINQHITRTCETVSSKPDLYVSFFWLCGHVKVLDAVSLEERFRTALPMLTRQIEGLKLLKKSKKLSPDTEKKVAGSSPVSLLSPSWVLLDCSWRVWCFPLQVLSLRKGGVFPGQNIGLDGEDEDEDSDDSSVLERKIRAANMPDAALKVCLKELKRLVFYDRCSCLARLTQKAGSLNNGNAEHDSFGLILI